jgi:hypothetical protein
MRLSPGHRHLAGPTILLLQRGIHLQQLLDFSLPQISCPLQYLTILAQLGRLILLSTSPSSRSSTTYSRHKLEELHQLLPHVAPLVGLVSFVCILNVFQPLL